MTYITEIILRTYLTDVAIMRVLSYFASKKLDNKDLKNP